MNSLAIPALRHASSRSALTVRTSLSQVGTGIIERARPTMSAEKLRWVEEVQPIGRLAEPEDTGWNIS